MNRLGRERPAAGYRRRGRPWDWVILKDLTNHKAAGGIILIVSRSSRRKQEGASVSIIADRSAQHDELVGAGADVAAQLARWLVHLGAERRMSPRTCEAYERDVRQFLAFLSEHRGTGVTVQRLARLAATDIRAFMAARRGDGISGRSLARGLAGARSFARFIERNGSGKVGSLFAVRSPKIAKTLPKPLAVAAARRVTQSEVRAGEDREPWILARDAAVLGLLYGSGLRISEALGLKRKEVPAPGEGDAITVTGKGNKQRMVPVLAQVLELIADYVALCPAALPGDGPLFIGAKGGPLSP